MERRSFKQLFQLFVAMFKIGLFTFGGGYAMIHILETEFISKKKWIESEEFLDLVAIAESTPGPIAINCSTYIGYKREKLLGAIVATLGMILPSFSIIYLISLFFNEFLAVEWVNSAFKGIRVCVVFLILSAGLKMLKKIKKTPLSVALICATFAFMLALSLFAVDFSSLVFILVGGAIGLLLYAVKTFRKKSKEGEEK